MSGNTILTILKNTEVSKEAGLDNLCGSFLKDGAKLSLSYAISQSPQENFLTPVNSKAKTNI